MHKGFNFKICRQSSEPIEPPAPVTITFLLDIDPEKGLKRKTFSNLNEDRFENQQIDFHYNIRKKYLELTEIYKNRFIKIDGSLNKIEIFEIIKSQIMNFFKKI